MEGPEPLLFAKTEIAGSATGSQIVFPGRPPASAPPASPSLLSQTRPAKLFNVARYQNMCPQAQCPVGGLSGSLGA